MSALYLIRKGGAYYRPNSQGYTRLAEEAGRYTLEEAEAITHPNGPHGPRDGMDYVPDPATEKNPAAVETAGLEIAIQRQPLTGDAQESAKITTAAGAVEKAAPIPALLPCPFCDNDGRLKEGHRDHWIVECVHCVATTGYYEARDGGKERAAAAWNRRADRASQEERIREDERAPETVNALEGLFWLELREPGLVPQRKGPWPHARTKEILREFMKVNPTAYISVVTMSHDGPWFADAPETLGIVDGRCWPTARKHIASSSAAHAGQRVDAS